MKGITVKDMTILLGNSVINAGLKNLDLSYAPAVCQSFGRCADTGITTDKVEKLAIKLTNIMDSSPK